MELTVTIPLVTVVVVAALSFLLGAAIAHYRTDLAWQQLAEEHHYERERLAAVRWRELYDTAEHELRRADRAEARFEQTREWLGDMLDHVARVESKYKRAIAVARHAMSSPRHLHDPRAGDARGTGGRIVIPAYGEHGSVRLVT